MYLHIARFIHLRLKDKEGSIAELARLCREYNVELIAIGNGTASRETEAVVAEMMAANTDLKLTRVTVSEAGACLLCK